MNMLRSIREKKGLSIGQLAARASIPTRILAEYEEGRQPIPLPHAKLIAKALWVRIEELMPPGGSTGLTPSPSQPAAQPPVMRPEYRPPQGQPPQQAPARTTPMPPPPDARPAYAPPPAPAPTPQPPPRPARDMQQGQVAGNQMATPAQADQRPSRFGEGNTPSQAPRPGIGGGQAVRKMGDGRTTRPSRPPASPPKAIGEGQIEELQRLGIRLEMEQAQLEERIGKPLSGLTRTEAKEWIKRFREMLEELSPSGRVAFGQWPGSHEDHEATYLAEQREAGATLQFKLFNGEQFTGKLQDFTPYTITVKLGNGEEIVLRKLSIVYYRQSTPTPTHDTARLDMGVRDTERLNTGLLSDISDIEPLQETGSGGEAPIKAKTEEPQEPVSAAAPPTGKAPASPRKKRTKAAAVHQPLDTNVGSDHVGEPKAPEKDHMDEDRGL